MLPHHTRSISGVIARFLAGVAVTAGLFTLGTVSLAQGPGPGGPPPGGGMGGFQMTPEMQAKIEAYRKWGQEHKNLTMVSRTLGLIEMMNQQKETQLDKKQSARLLAIVNQWKGKPTLTEDQAKTLDGQMTAVLNPKQLEQLKNPNMQGMGAMRGMGFGGMGKMAPGAMGGAGKMAPGAMAGAPGKMAPGASGKGNGKGDEGAPPKGMPGGMGKGGPGGMGKGGPGGMGGFQLPDPPKNGYNPLNPDTLPFEMLRPMAKQQMTTFVTTLEKQAK